MRREKKRKEKKRTENKRFIATGALLRKRLPALLKSLHGENSFFLFPLLFHSVEIDASFAFVFALVQLLL
jgi:hypothetical protein